MHGLHTLFATMVLTFATPLAVNAKDLQTAVLAGGCFWCVEADYDKVQGVVKTVSGYTGGDGANPTYKTATKKGHREAVQITFDADKISYAKILDIFWRSVDPTDGGGQFCDRGHTYSTAIYATPKQLKTAKASKADLEKNSPFRENVVTPVLLAKAFYPAENTHQNYHNGTGKVLTRFGYISQAKAYKRYRQACGRDARVKQLWGRRAFVVAGE